MLNRWYNILRPRQKDVKQESINLIVSMEKEEKQKQEILQWTATDSNVLLSRLYSSAVSEIAKDSSITNLKLRGDQINSNDDNDADEFLSDCATSYESFDQLEQRTSDKESFLTSVKQELQLIEESVVIGDIRKCSEKSLDSIQMKGEFVTKITNFMNAEALVLHDHIDILEKYEYHLQEMVSPLQQLSSLSALVTHDDKSLVLNASSVDPASLYGIGSTSESSENSKFSRLAYSLESLPTVPFSYHHPFLLLDNTQKTPNSYFLANAPFYINCSEVGISNNRDVQGNFYISDIVLLQYLKTLPLKNRLSHVRAEKSLDTTDLKYGIENGLLDRKSEIRSEQFDHGLNVILSMNGESSMYANSINPYLPSERFYNDNCISFYNGNCIHMDAETAISDFGLNTSICQNNENTEHTIVLEFNEQIYDTKTPNRIPQKNDFFLSCYDTFENGNDREIPLIISSSGDENKTRETTAATTASIINNDDATKLKKSKTFDGSVSMGTHKLLNEPKDATNSLTNSTKTFENGVLQQQNHPLMPVSANKSLHSHEANHQFSCIPSSGTKLMLQKKDDSYNGPSAGSPSAGSESAYGDDEMEREQEEVLGSDDEEQEDPKDYRKGGYHPVAIGDVFNGRYHVIRKMGWGHFSTVWLCWDTAQMRFVAMKIVKSAEHYTEAALDEIKLLMAVRNADENDLFRERVVQLLDEFSVTGVNGTHVCMVFEVLGCNLLKLIIRSNYQGLPLEQVRIIIKQVLEGLQYLHEKCQIIHTDIKPENVLVTMTHEQVRRIAAEAILSGKMGFKLSGSAVSTAPQHMVKKIEEAMSKNKKKKLKKKRKKQRELLEQQLVQMEGLTVDPNIVLASLNSEQRNKLLGKQSSNGCNVSSSNQYAIPELLCTAAVAAAKMPSGNNASMSARLHHNGGTNGIIRPYTSHSVGAKPAAAKAFCNTTYLTVDEEYRYNQLKSEIVATKAEDVQINDFNGKNTSVVARQNQHVPVEIPVENVALKAVEVEDAAEDPLLSPVRNSDLVVEEPPRFLSHMDSDFRSESEVRESALQLLLEKDGLSPKRAEPDYLNPATEINVKLADLGNACWTHHHFTEDIQTRQYRSLEVLIGAGYGPPADIWSTACMAFELATGDYLFEPHSGDTYSRDEDHLAHIIELLGTISPRVYKKGAHWREFFDKHGRLLHIHQLKPWSLVEVLTQKYDWPIESAGQFASFLIPMLAFDQEERATARQCLQHDWLKPNGGKPLRAVEKQQDESSELDDDSDNVEGEEYFVMDEMHAASLVKESQQSVSTNGGELQIGSFCAVYIPGFDPHDTIMMLLRICCQGMIPRSFRWCINISVRTA
ncbi:Serine/threonine-protein kinase [Dirofilaria immitis]